MSTTVVKEVCECQNCGNEAEMIVTCTLQPVEAAPASKNSPKAPAQVKEVTKKNIFCKHCGNEAEIII